ncbi:MAG: sensor histidine kinase [Flammeovirgaceae bacterium]
MLNQIPLVWRKAYGIVCLWYLVNVFISSFTTYYLFHPFQEEFVYGIFVFFFYMIYILIAWLWSNFLFDKTVGFQAIGHITGVLCAFLAVSYLFYQLGIIVDNRIADTFQEYLIESQSGTNTTGRMDAFRIYNEYGAIIFIAYVIRYATNLKRREQEKAQLMVQNKDMQLNLLKSQINPHFLFNTLNSISTLVGVSKEKARKVISQLSNVIRYTLETGENRFVPLTDELQFIDNYLRIQQVRFSEAFEVEKNIDPACIKMEIPPMVLQPLVENAVKYGVGQADGKGKIWINILQKEGYALFEIVDNGPGIHANKVLDGKSSTGIGNQNTDKRLRNIYGELSGLQTEAREDGFTARFKIPV